MYVRHTLIVVWATNALGDVVSISYCARLLHAEVLILAVYAKYVALPTKSMSIQAMDAKTLERELQRRFQSQSSTRQEFLNIISTYSQ